MEGGLVDHGAADDGGAVVLVGDVQSVEPGRPPGAEMSLDADLVLLGAAVISRRGAAWGVGGAVVWVHARTVRTDLVSAHHMMW